MAEWWEYLIGRPANVGKAAAAAVPQMEQKLETMGADRNEQLQKEFAQHGIRWRVEDAKAAGIAPLAALGASTVSFQPFHVQAETRQSPISQMAASLGSQMLGQFGQNLLGSAMRGMNMDERMTTMQNMQMKQAELSLENQSLQNQYLASQIARSNAASPAFPGGNGDNFIPGQGNTPLVIDQPLKRTVSAPGRPAQEAGWRPDVSFSRTDTGLTPMVPESLSESLEDDIIGKVMWRVRNQLVPNIASFVNPHLAPGMRMQDGKPPRHMLPKGANDWSWSYWKQEWQPTRR